MTLGQLLEQISLKVQEIVNKLKEILNKDVKQRRDCLFFVSRETFIKVVFVIGRRKRNVKRRN